MSDPEVSLRKHLKKFFNLCSSHHAKKLILLQGLKEHLTTLRNQQEQFCVCSRVNVQQTSLADFPNIKSSILNKIRTNFDLSVEEIKSAMMELTEAHKSIAKQHDQVMSTYNKQCRDLSLDCLCEASATVPSIASMLEWADDLNQDFAEDIAMKEASLSHLRLSDESSVDAAVESWSKQDDTMLKKVLFYTQYFLEEEI